VGVLIERESELAVLGEVVEAAVAGSGGAVLVEGEAGIGKTRLLGLARVRAAAAGARVLYATADESEASVPLAAARELLVRAARGVAPDGPASLGVLALDGGLSDPSGPGSRSDEVVHALWWLIVELADEQPLALFLDDAQWADQLTLHLLRLAARRARELPLALVVAARPAAPGHAHLVLTAERSFVRLEPPPLSVAGTARLVEAVLGRSGPVGLVARARALTRGNPLYLWELLQAARVRGLDSMSEVFVDDGAPPQLVRLVGDRLGRLSPAATTLARAVAVLGADAESGRARALAGLEAREAIAAEEELRNERVLDPLAYGFTHPVVAAAAREGIAAVDAAELHARAAALLADDGVDDQRVAEHLVSAPPRGDAGVVATLRRAAETARRLGALTNAARLLERALAEPPTPQLVDAVDFERGRSMLDAGTEDGARVLARVAQRAPDVSLRVDAARQLARRFGLDGRGAEAVAVLRGVLEALPDAEREMRLELLVELAFIDDADLATHEEAARMIAAEAADATGRTPGERLVLVASHVIGGERPSDPASAARHVLALRLHRDYPGGFAVGSVTFGAIAMLINADALDDAERAMDQLRADAEAMASPDLVAGALWQQAQIAYQRGDLARCELESRSAAEAGGEFAGSLATPWLVMALAEQGRLDEAKQLLESAGMLGPISTNTLLTAMLGGRGRLWLAQGDAPRAVEDLTAARDRSAALFPERVEPPWQPLLVEALVLADRSDEAAEEAAAYAALAVGWGTRRALGHAARVRALVAPREPAIALLEEARTHFAASHARLELARCLTELGARRRAAGERRAARAILRDAHDTAHACGATALCERARAELLLAGGRPRPPAGAGADALTPAERRVAEIAADGATNREIARRLYLSPKTVEMHLRSAYRKLDLTGRDGLAAALR
jgi:DNA-binding CsgD family transcriptional regulator